MKTTPQTCLAALGVLCALSLALPQPASAYDKSAFVSPGDEARIVFIQNLREDRTMSYIVFDSDKQCIAEVRGRQAKVIPMKPGKHTLYISGYNNHRIDVDLFPGRTYFVRLFSIEKFANRVSDVTPVQRGSESYKLVKTWLEGANIAKASDDTCRGKPLKERKNRTIRRINDANADWKNGDEIYRYRYMLLKEDGFTPAEIDWL